MGTQLESFTGMLWGSNKTGNIPLCVDQEVLKVPWCSNEHRNAVRALVCSLKATADHAMAYPNRALGPDFLWCSHQCGFQVIFEVHDRLRAGPQLFPGSQRPRRLRVSIWRATVTGVRGALEADLAVGPVAAAEELVWAAGFGVKVATGRRQGGAAWGPWGLPLPRQVGGGPEWAWGSGTQLPARTGRLLGKGCEALFSSSGLCLELCAAL